jgi:hypothetical protein
MPRTALEDIQFEKVKQHIVDPGNSPLNPEQQIMLDRIVSAAKILDKNPVQKNAVLLHMKKYPEIGRTRAYMDVRMAVKLFNTLHEFDFDFWQTWMINDIITNINRARDLISDSGNDKQQGALLRVIAMEHANLIRAIGEKPKDLPDPRLTEKHQFYLLLQVNNGSTTHEVKIDHAKLKNLPQAALSELNRILFAGKEINEEQAQDIMDS